MDAHQDGERFLRRVFGANAVTSAGSGLVLLIGGHSLAPYFALGSGWILMAIGAGLLVFAARLVQNNRRPVLNRVDAWMAAAGDVAWVLGSVALLAFGWDAIPVVGKWLIALTADIVAVFGALQIFGLLRHQQEQSPSAVTQ